MLCRWERLLIGDIGAAFTYHGVITSIVLELVDFELALSVDLRHYSTDSSRKRCKYISET